MEYLSDLIGQEVAFVDNIKQRVFCSNDEIERKYRDNLVLDIIYNNINNQDELRERGKLFGWSFEGHVRAMIADVDHFKKHREKNAGSPLWRKCRFRKKRQIVL